MRITNPTILASGLQILKSWHFIEVANDIRNIKNQLIEKIQSI